MTVRWASPVHPLPNWLRWGTVVALCVSWVQIPQLSTVALLVVSLGSVLAIVRGARSFPCSGAASLALLGFFCVLFYGASWSYGFMPLSDAVKLGGYAVGSYATGYVLGQRLRPGTTPFLVTVLAPAAVFTVFTFLCVSISPMTLARELGERTAEHFFVRGQHVAATVLGPLASLGMCLGPVVLFARRQGTSRATHLTIMAAAGTLAAAGTYSNLVLQNRSPLFALALSLVVGAYLALRGRRSLSSMLRVVGVLLIVSATAVIKAPHIMTLGIYDRFLESGMRTGRYESWSTVMAAMFESPFGGRTSHLVDGFAHNAWLDVAYDAGVIPFACLIVFHARHIRTVTTHLGSSVPLTHRLAAAGIFSSLAVAFMVEPVLQFGSTYFGATCFLLAFLAATRPGASVRSAPLYSDLEGAARAAQRAVKAASASATRS